MKPIDSPGSFLVTHTELNASYCSPEQMYYNYSNLVYVPSRTPTDIKFIVVDPLSCIVFEHKDTFYVSV